MRLAPLLALLRKHGVTSYSADGVSLTFGASPAAAPAKPKKDEKTDEPEPLPTDAVALALKLGAR